MSWESILWKLLIDIVVNEILLSYFYSNSINVVIDTFGFPTSKEIYIYIYIFLLHIYYNIIYIFDMHVYILFTFYYNFEKVK
jgi:hypothetical protein